MEGRRPFDEEWREVDERGGEMEGGVVVSLDPRPRRPRPAILQRPKRAFLFACCDDRLVSLSCDFS